MMLATVQLRRYPPVIEFTSHTISTISSIKINLKRKEARLNPAGIYLLKVNNRNTRTSCEICSKLTKKTLVLVSLLLTLNIFHNLL